MRSEFHGAVSKNRKWRRHENSQALPVCNLVEIACENRLELVLLNKQNFKMPQRCVAGGCSKTAKDGVSLHGWPSIPQVARLWTNAVRNTRANFSPTTSSKLCSVHFSEDSFETQSVMALSLGLNMKRILKPEAVPTIFNGPPNKKQRRDDGTGTEESSSHWSRPRQSGKQPRGAYRKREAARVRVTDYLKLAFQYYWNPWITNNLTFLLKIIAER